MSEHKCEEEAREEVIGYINKLADGDNPPTSDEYQDYGPTSMHTFRTHFESWNEAVKEAGYYPNRCTNISPEEILEAISRLADDDSPPTSKEYLEKGPTSLELVHKYFGSWDDAISEAGFDSEVRLSREEILESVQEVAEDLGHQPTESEFNEHGISSSQTAKRRCDGDWESVIEAAGFNYTKKLGKHYRRSELTEEIHRLADEYGQPPTAKQMNEKGDYSTSPYKIRWGSYCSVE